MLIWFQADHSQPFKEEHQQHSTTNYRTDYIDLCSSQMNQKATPNTLSLLPPIPHFHPPPFSILDEKLQDNEGDR